MCKVDRQIKLKCSIQTIKKQSIRSPATRPQHKLVKVLLR